MLPRHKITPPAVFSCHPQLLMKFDLNQKLYPLPRITNLVKSILFVATIFIFASCDKNVVDDDLHGSENFNRTIKFDVIHVYSVSPILDSVVALATVDIYYDYYDFLNESYPAASRITDSTGHCEISGLDKDFYYVRASHPAFADVKDSVSTPANTTSFVEMIFY